MSAKPLNNISLWITRPRGQGDKLSDMLKEKGAKVLHLPMMQIEKSPVDKKTLARIKKLKDYNMVFFISTNAAQFGMELIESKLSRIPDEPRYFAPGPSTAKVLESYGMKVAYPKEAMSTEALLSMPAVQRSLEKKKPRKKKALIFRGEGGRELLANALREKGVEVFYVELYKRVIPKFSKAYLKEIIDKRKPDGIVFTSGESIQNFIVMFEDIFKQYRQIPIFVSSQRLADHAKQLGFETITILQAADDTSVTDGVSKAHG